MPVLPISVRRGPGLNGIDLTCPTTHTTAHTQYDELACFVREEVGRHLEEQRRLEAKHAELSLQWERLARVGVMDVGGA